MQEKSAYVDSVTRLRVPTDLEDSKCCLGMQGINGLVLISLSYCI